MPHQRIIYWFRNDLRLHDNGGFLKATQNAEEVVPVYVFTPANSKKHHWDFQKRVL